MIRHGVRAAALWGARILTVVPVLAALFITFEDWPDHHPLAAPFPLILAPFSLYLGVALVLLGWRWPVLGIASIGAFGGAYAVVAAMLHVYADGLLVCMVPGVLYAVSIVF